MLYERIKEIASKQGRSVRSIEKAVHFSNGSLSKWNESIPSADKLLKVARYLGVTMDSLLDETD